MKTKKIVLIIVCALVVVIAAVVGLYFAYSAKKVPELQRTKLRDNPISYSTVYVVGQAPYTDLAVFETRTGLEFYWREHHSGGNGMELILQRSKDGKLIVLSEPLPAKSNAEVLYGKGIRVGDLTLEQLQKVNLMYHFKDEDGVQIYADSSDDELEYVCALTLEDVLEYFAAPNRITARLFVRYMDEAQMPNIEAAVTDVYNALESTSMLSKAVYCPLGEADAAAVDKVCPDMMRAATTAEAKALSRDSMSEKPNDALPYSAIYEKATGQFSGERFIHYARNLGLAVVLSDVSEKDIAKLHGYGVTAIASDKVGETIRIIRDARTAERAAKQTTDSSAQP